MSLKAQVVYPLLQENLHLLDDNFARILRDWATAKLAEVEAEQAQAIAAVIGNFSNLIKQFPLGSQANNLEIAIWTNTKFGERYPRYNPVAAISIASSCFSPKTDKK
ncbi:hypothetical protein [Coleofasciculus sp. E2-BRE-01]|uniref:hypothetical protein n=1 Tax=Coleofasciculus sp. E2-BRE-01 TaxID=3069524 RepID=UPI0032F30C9F